VITWTAINNGSPVMTFCLGINVRDGVVALADTRIVRGSERTSRHKLEELTHANQSVLTMTSGLRSVRDKTLAYLDESLRQDSPQHARLYQFVNLFCEQLRRVKEEDGASLAATRLVFNLHAVIGGQLPEDESARLYYVYPEGNWVAAATDSPYFVIGRTYYGKPILDRLLNFDSSLRSAVALALLAFDATRTSVTDVDYPIDVAVLRNGSRKPTVCRYTERDLAETTTWWSTHLRQSLDALPMDWAAGLFPGDGGSAP
jgi:putative proteasome-type protease